MTRQSKTLALLMGLCAAVIGCSAELRPAPGAKRLGGAARAAYAEAENVRLTAAPNGWSGAPANLREIVTPLHVILDNRSAHPLRIRYDQFRFVGGSGAAVAARPPYRIRGTVIEPIFMPHPRYWPGGFEPAPHYRFPEAGTYAPRHPWNYDEYTPRYDLWAAPLPTADMVEKGLPEGVLEPGGSISGFLYFADIPDDSRRAMFEADLVDADAGGVIGTLRIPFVWN